MMNFPKHSRLVAAVLIIVASTAIPTATDATLLWGHPYAMVCDQNDQGWVHMWNDTNPGTPYVGTAVFQNISANTGFEHMWDACVLGMVNKKLTLVWTDAGPDSNVNDQSTGNIRSIAVTIFGN